MASNMTPAILSRSFLLLICRKILTYQGIPPRTVIYRSASEYRTTERRKFSERYLVCKKFRAYQGTPHTSLRPFHPRQSIPAVMAFRKDEK